MKPKTLFWYLKRPSFYPYMVEEIARKFRKPRRGTLTEKSIASERCSIEAVSLSEFLSQKQLAKVLIPTHLRTFGEQMELKNHLGLGARAPFEGLLGSLIFGRRYGHVLETGVATGWSSLEILATLRELGEKHLLISTDMPYPTKNFEPYVGCVVPDYLRENWVIIKEPDRNGLFEAFKACPVPFDLIHYDSDKSYWGRMWAYPLLLEKLGEGGVFISDDVGDNLAFFDFCELNRLSYRIIVKDDRPGQYVGLIER